MRINLSISEAYNERFDKMACEFGWSRSELLRRMIELFEEEKLEKRGNR